MLYERHNVGCLSVFRGQGVVHRETRQGVKNFDGNFEGLLGWLAVHCRGPFEESAKDLPSAFVAPAYTLVEVGIESPHRADAAGYDSVLCPEIVEDFNEF